MVVSSDTIKGILQRGIISKAERLCNLRNACYYYVVWFVAQKIHFQEKFYSWKENSGYRKGKFNTGARKCEDKKAHVVCNMEHESGNPLITKNILHAGTKSVTFTSGTKVGYCRVSIGNNMGKSKIHVIN